MESFGFENFLNEAMYVPYSLSPHLSLKIIKL